MATSNKGNIEFWLIRHGDAWTAETIKSLLKYGGEKRPFAALRLADPEIRYPWAVVAWGLRL